MKLFDFGTNKVASLDVSIIVVSKDFPNVNFQAFLNSTKVLTINYELIIVTHKLQSSNYSQILKSMLENQPNLIKARLLLLNHNVDLGPAHDRNVGAKLSDSPNILFADDDTIFLEDITSLLHYLQTDKCAGLQPLLLRSGKNDVVDSAGDFIWKAGLTYRPYSRHYEKTLQNGDLCIEEVPSMKSALMLVKKNVFFAVGGFDSSFNFNYEDVDLGWRMTSAGFKLLFVPSSRAIHKGGRVSSGLAKQTGKVVKLGIVNFYICHFKLRKYPSWPLLFISFQVEYVFQALMRRKKWGPLAGNLKDILAVNLVLLERVRFVKSQKPNLSAIQIFDGVRKLEDMARGKRFLYNK